MLVALTFDQGAVLIQRGKKSFYLTSGAGKTGHPYVKTNELHILHHIQKLPPDGSQTEMCKSCRRKQGTCSCGRRLLT